MRSKRVPALVVLVALSLLCLIALSGCGRDTDALKPAPPNDDPVVFDDTFGSGVDYQAFLNSKVDAVSIVTDEKAEGTASLKVTVPAPGHPTDWFAGGAFTTTLARDLSGYNALTFWAKASKASTFDVVGFGNDNTGTSLYEATWSNIPLTTTWTRFTVPIPVPERLSSERGLFFIAEGGENNEGHEVWFDDVRFETVTTISNPRPGLTPRNLVSFVGQTVNVEGTQTTFDVDGQPEVIEHSPGYFTFASSDENVVAVTGGQVLVVGPGSATITAMLGDVDVAGTVDITSSEPPATAAPAPVLPSGDVISLFSLAYSDETVDTWSAEWDAADVTDLTVDNDDIKAYTNLIFAGIEFTSNPVNAATMTHFHMDLWVPGGSVFRIKLVDFGANGVYAGGDDSEYEIPLSSASTPALAADTWINVDIPLASFTGLKDTAHLAQLVISGDVGTAFMDNVYFHK
jgi:hypothetical protein